MLWEALPEQVMDAALRVHHRVVRAALLAHSGYESATEGDSFIAAFHTPLAALRFALEAQQALLAAPWPPDLLQHAPLPGVEPQEDPAGLLVMLHRPPVHVPKSAHPSRRNSPAPAITAPATPNPTTSAPKRATFQARPPLNATTTAPNPSPRGFASRSHQELRQSDATRPSSEMSDSPVLPQDMPRSIPFPPFQGPVFPPGSILPRSHPAAATARKAGARLMRSLSHMAPVAPVAAAAAAAAAVFPHSLDGPLASSAAATPLSLATHSSIAAEERSSSCGSAEGGGGGGGGGESHTLAADAAVVTVPFRKCSHNARPQQQQPQPQQQQPQQQQLGAPVRTPPAYHHQSLPADSGGAVTTRECKACVVRCSDCHSGSLIGSSSSCCDPPRAAAAAGPRSCTAAGAGLTASTPQLPPASNAISSPNMLPLEGSQVAAPPEAAAAPMQANAASQASPFSTSSTAVTAAAAAAAAAAPATGQQPRPLLAPPLQSSSFSPYEQISAVMSLQDSLLCLESSLGPRNPPPCGTEVGAGLLLRHEPLRAAAGSSACPTLAECLRSQYTVLQQACSSTSLTAPPQAAVWDARWAASESSPAAAAAAASLAAAVGAHGSTFAAAASAAAALGAADVSSDGRGREAQVVAFRGLRVRMGLHSGVPSVADVGCNEASGRIAYSGNPLRLAKAVSDAANGGMILLSETALQQLLLDPSAPKALQNVLLLWMGQHHLGAGLHDMHLFQALARSLTARLALQRPLRTHALLPPFHGALCAPMQHGVLARLTVVGAGALLAWNRSVASYALDLLYEAVTEELRTAVPAGSAQPYIVEGAFGLYTECPKAAGTGRRSEAYAAAAAGLTPSQTSGQLERACTGPLSAGLVPQFSCASTGGAGGGGGSRGGGVRACTHSTFNCKRSATCSSLSPQQPPPLQPSSASPASGCEDAHAPAAAAGQSPLTPEPPARRPPHSPRLQSSMTDRSTSGSRRGGGGIGGSSGGGGGFVRPAFRMSSLGSAAASWLSAAEGGRGGAPGVMTAVLDSPHVGASWLLRVVDLLPCLDWPSELLHNALCEEVAFELPAVLGALDTDAGLARQRLQRRSVVWAAQQGVQQQQQQQQLPPQSLRSSGEEGESSAIGKEDLAAAVNVKAPATATAAGAAPITTAAAAAAASQPRPPDAAAAVAAAAAGGAMAAGVAGDGSSGSLVWRSPTPPREGVVFRGLRVRCALVCGELVGELPAGMGASGHVVYRGKAWSALGKVAAKSKAGEVATNAATAAMLPAPISGMVVVKSI
ncbi:hypothetical protein Agub_g2065 [Astrephomene gubernaculifera]|uniref:Guanylate cyclase domain-containing protein n=1 Tax=Astrephomene gubernaculifera TaxID=47775 RepID=A0AAD3DJ61_9CHLO|nr:hypothetical protein Agub_g2065 [Astrephomene gubernaculifera]